MTQTRLSARSWAELAALALIWGGSFVSIHAALEEVGVFTAVAFRVGLAALALWSWVLLRGLPVPRTRHFLFSCLFLGLVNNILPFSLIIWGQTHIPSGLAGILNASNAIFAVGLAALVFPDERLTPRRMMGVVLGFGGVALTVGPGLLSQFDLTSLGQLAVLGAALAYAISAIFSRRRLVGLRPEVVAAGMLTVSSLVMVPFAFWAEGAPTLDYGWTTWAGLLYISILSSAFAYILYYGVLQRAGAGNASLVTLMIAPVAVILGAVIYREALAPHVYLGMVLILAGMGLIDGWGAKIGLAIFRVKKP
jgi:drug/metabolite transporter (DMT)-like permease